MSEGWICPKCETVWAPWVMSCNCGTVPQKSDPPPWTHGMPRTGDPMPDDHHTTCENKEHTYER